MASFTNLPIHDDGSGEIRFLGQVPPPVGSFVETMESQVTAIDPSQWVEFEYADSPVKIKDQNGKGACNGHAAATSLEWARFIAGYTHFDLSAWFVYAILCNGIDRGSNIGDALSLLSKQGTSLDASVPYATINPGRIPSPARTEASRFRVEIGAPLRNFADMMSATQANKPGNFSICVGGSFNRLDSDGCVGYSPGWGNHAVTFGLGAKKSKSGEWLIKCQNSWAERWGLNGFFYIRAQHVDRQSMFEAYCVGVAAEDLQDPLKPPVAP